jgi:hypothetical protein
MTFLTDLVIKFHFQANLVTKRLVLYLGTHYYMLVLWRHKLHKNVIHQHRSHM